ncbi:MAG: glycine cleavage system aminomethyltransferase GcvT [Cyanobacteria bacterium]|nr:glycine cleavage system aminomethyltransferase GcvT [Cyanobacteriota bacterium]
MQSELSTLCQTPLGPHHRSVGAKMVPFAGWEMPLQFSKVKEEHLAVRSAAGLFDIGHMGLVTLQLDEASLGAFNALVPQDLRKLTPGKAVYTQFLNERGGIIDDLIIYRLPELSDSQLSDAFSGWLVICNASNTAEDIAWMQQHLSVPLKHQTHYTLFALQGPHFSAVLDRFGVRAEQLPARFHVAELSVKLPTGDSFSILVARTGYTGEDGVELIVPIAFASVFWAALIEQGAPLGLLPIGLAARDTLRLEAAYPLHGHDITPDYTPIEAGLGWSVKWAEDNAFIGRDALNTQKQTANHKHFVCFNLSGRTIPRQDDTIMYQGKAVGVVTSGSISMSLGHPIAMGYVDASTPHAPGDILQIQVRDTLAEATITSRPFYSANRIKG